MPPIERYRREPRSNSIFFEHCRVPDRGKQALRIQGQARRDVSLLLHRASCVRCNDEYTQTKSQRHQSYLRRVVL